MNPPSSERWRTIEHHFASVLELDETARSAYLELHCSSDPGLRSDLERLLHSHRSAGEFLAALDVTAIAALVAEGDEELELAGPIGPYEVLRALGRGGMGVVYLARDVRLDRLVALKLLATHGGDRGAARLRLTQEARAASAIAHPNIATVYDIGEGPDGALFIAMAYCEGSTLRERIRAGTLAARDVARIGLQIAEALAAAHRRGIVHRDVKPANVIVDDRGVARLLDFGIASLAGGAAGAHQRAGTIAYMSPEQARGEAPAPASDVWSLGATMYEALTGARPSNDGAVPAPPLRRAGRMVPPPLARVIDRALAPSPADRYADGAALSAELQRALERMEHAATRRRSWRIAAAVAVLLGGAGVYAAKARGEASVRVREETIAVLPFSAAGDSLLERLGEELSITLAANLDAVGELRTIDALPIINSARGQPPTTDRERMAFARRAGAGRVLHGTLVRAGTRVRVDAALGESRSGRTLARATLLGDPDAALALADSLTWALLQRLRLEAGAPSNEQGLLMTRSLPALRAFLEGERMVAEGRLRQAPEAFARAFAADSAFWIAYWRYAQTRDYWGLQVEPSVRRAYQDNRDALPLRDRMLIAARLRDSVSDRLESAREITRRFPDYLPGWFELAEQLVHSSPLLGSTRAEAAVALEQVVRLNPGHVPAWNHRFWLAIAERDTATTRLVLDRLTAMNFDSVGIDEEQVPTLPLYRYMAHAARHGGVPDRALARHTIAGLVNYAGRIPLDDFAAAPSLYGLHQAEIELGRQLATTPGIPAGIAVAARRGTALAWAGRGDWDSAILAFREYLRAEDNDAALMHAYRLAAFGEWLGELPAHPADEWEMLLVRRLDRLAPPARAELAWLQGIRAAARSDGAAVERARASLLAAGAPAVAALLDRSLLAFRRAIDGDTAAAVEILTALERERAQRRLAIGPANAHPYVTPVNRLAASAWLLSQGDTVQAAELLTWTDAVIYYAPLVANVNALVAGIAYHRLAAIDEARGRPDRAAQRYRLYLDRVDRPSASERARHEHATAFVARQRR